MKNVFSHQAFHFSGNQLCRWGLALLGALLLIGGLLMYESNMNTGSVEAFQALPVTNGVASVPNQRTEHAFNHNGSTRLLTSSPVQQCTLTITPNSLPNLPGGVAFNQTLTVSGGTAPYDFNVSGRLPFGLTLSPDGVLSGTPNYAGTFNFTITATTPNGCTGNRSYSMNVTATLGPQTGVLYFLIDSQFGRNNQIFGLAVNELTGALTVLPGFPFELGFPGSNGAFTSERLSLDRKNLRLYALNRLGLTQNHL